MNVHVDLAGKAKAKPAPLPAAAGKSERELRSRLDEVTQAYARSEERIERLLQEHEERMKKHDQIIDDLTGYKKTLMAIALGNLLNEVRLLFPNVGKCGVSCAGR